MFLIFENKSQYLKVQDIRVRNNEIYYNILYAFVEVQEIDKDVKGVCYRMKVDINRGGNHNLIDILGVADAISIIGCSIDYELLGVSQNKQDPNIFVILKRNDITPIIFTEGRGTIDVICYTFDHDIRKLLVKGGELSLN